MIVKGCENGCKFCKARRRPHLRIDWHLAWGIFYIERRWERRWKASRDVTLGHWSSRSACIRVVACTVIDWYWLCQFRVHWKFIEYHWVNLCQFESLRHRQCSALGASLPLPLPFLLSLGKPHKRDDGQLPNLPAPKTTTNGAIWDIWKYEECGMIWDFMTTIVKIIRYNMIQSIWIRTSYVSMSSLRQP